MSNNIFIASTEPRTGKSLVTLGLIHALQGIIPQVKYMKPVGQLYSPGKTIDKDAELIKNTFNLKDSISNINPVSLHQIQENKDQAFDKIFNAINTIQKNADVVVIEGTDYTSTVSALEFDINAELARNLSGSVLLITQAKNKNTEQLIEALIETAQSFKNENCNILGAVVNRVSANHIENNLDTLKKALAKENIPLFGILPENPTIAGPRLREVASEIGAEIFYQGDDLSRIVTGARILAMTPENALTHIRDKNGYLLIAPGDRPEYIFTAINAHNAANYPQFAGIILTGGLTPGSQVRELIQSLPAANLSILSVPYDTFDTALKINNIHGSLNSQDTEKLNLVFNQVETNLDIDSLRKAIGEIKSNIRTPRMFQYQLIEMAKKKRKHIVLPEGEEPRIIKAAAEILTKEICDLTLVGNKDAIIKKSKEMGVNIDNAVIADPLTASKEIMDDYTQTYYELRKHKGITIKMAKETMMDTVHFATMMVYKNAADGFVSGAIHSTGETLAPVLRIIRTQKDVSLASSVFLMCMPDKVLLYGDCALVENPDSEQMADIATTSAETAKLFDIEPRIALLSYSTGSSGKGKDVEKVQKAAEIAKNKRPDLAIEGPIQYDAATSEEVAKVKLKDSKVAGKATIFIFPDLDAGNNAYKAVQRTAGIPAIGPVLQGLKKPANDLSRGATVTDIVYTVAITAIQAQNIKT